MTFTRCTRCLYPNTKPDLHFNAAGVCSACTSTEKRDTIDWDARLEELRAILNAHDMECIVPSSGGKDSTYQVLRLQELGARVTVVTAATCDLSAMGRSNIDNLARFAPTIEVTPNRTVRAKLNRLAMQMVGDPSWPEHVSIHRTPFKIAKQLGIGLIMYGECGPEAYGGPPGADETRRMTQRFVSEYGGFLGLRAQDFIGLEGITECDMEAYTAPSDAELESAGVQAYFLGQFEKWDSHRNARVAIEHGFRSELPTVANWWKWENIDNLQVAIHDHMMFLKYGYGRACAQLSVDVRNGLLSREEAMAELKPIDGRYPLVYMRVLLADILARIGITEKRYIDICNQYLNRDIFAEDVRWGGRPTFKDEDAAWA